MKSCKYYTFSDVQAARSIINQLTHRFVVTANATGISTSTTDSHDNTLFPTDWIEWAKDVIDWFSLYLKTIKLMASKWFNGDRQLAVKAMWKWFISTHTCSGMMFHTHLRVLSSIRHGDHLPTTRTQRVDPIYKGVTVKAKVAKHRRRTSYARTTSGMYNSIAMHV